MPGKRCFTPSPSHFYYRYQRKEDSVCLRSVTNWWRGISRPSVCPSPLRQKSRSTKRDGLASYDYSDLCKVVAWVTIWSLSCLVKWRGCIRFIPQASCKYGSHIERTGVTIHPAPTEISRTVAIQCRIKDIAQTRSFAILHQSFDKKPAN